MLNFYKSKLAPVLVNFVKAAPILVTASMGFRFLFIAMQVASIWFIFGWVGGHVNSYIVSFVGVSVESYIYPCIGAIGFICSTVFSLFSKMCALKATFKFEGVVVEKSIADKSPMTKGDLKNIVKLMISVLDVVVPLGLIIAVSILWAFITPYSLMIFVFIACSGIWLLRKGVIFSAKRYKPVSTRNKLDSYVGSEEHLGFYKVLLLPNYIALVIISIISVSIVLSLIATKLYFSSHGSHVGYMAILTGVAFLQIKSFASIILRAGAYNKSLAAVHGVLVSKTDAV
ncbi:hypothetical protein DNK06_05205 [Pseudomonas daroniae]|uniref:Uncharacterized protein n=1 Tax=Phytopseudomonas daroniae TaxID=2487519 RepID=A0A4Q9QNZ5_9GAMM|nr:MULTISPECIES: hypothetical protein [Pseudomonas]TBU81919.1 hypothetical protein DNK06_05205 [Pseudomonas daroniae]TBU84744.1 hypothetical protein DNK31_07305 [Pseudomonas sp. FRB 228]TBU92221.1 hypothetical protein DNJ99_07350 [Pseudomonas daroniae]